MTARPRGWGHATPDLSAGACVGMDPHLFDTDLNHTPTAAAVAACGACPVRATCLEWSAREGEVGMVWAGQARRGRWVATDPHLRTAVLDRTARGWSVRAVADDLDVDRLVVAAIRAAAKRRAS